MFLLSYYICINYHAIYGPFLWEISAEKERRCVLCCSVLMVVGAGRGPLVRASIAASHQADRKIKKVYAVEKNPNAVVT